MFEQLKQQMATRKAEEQQQEVGAESCSVLPCPAMFEVGRAVLDKVQDFECKNLELQGNLS